MVGDSTKSSVQIKSYFGLINRVACFLFESYKRISVWENVCKNSSKSKKLKKIVETRWWSKSNAINTLFRNYHNQKDEVYSIVLAVLKEISDSTDFNEKTCSEASFF